MIAEIGNLSLTVCNDCRRQRGIRIFREPDDAKNYGKMGRRSDMRQTRDSNRE